MTEELASSSSTPSLYLPSWRNWQRISLVMRGLWVQLPSTAFIYRGVSKWLKLAAFEAVIRRFESCHPCSPPSGRHFIPIDPGCWAVYKQKPQAVSGMAEVAAYVLSVNGSMLISKIRGLGSNPRERVFGLTTLYPMKQLLRRT